MCRFLPIWVMRVDFSWPVSGVWVSCQTHKRGQSDTVWNKSTILVTYFPTDSIFNAFLGVVFDLSTFQIAFFIPHSPCSHLGVVSALFQNCVLRHLWCVSRDVRVLGTGRNFVGGGGGGGEAGMRVGCSQLQQQIPTFSLCFGHVSLNGVFLSFSKVGLLFYFVNSRSILAVNCYF